MTLRTLLAFLVIATTAVAAPKPATTNQKVPASATTVRVAPTPARTLPSPQSRPAAPPSGPILNPGAVLDISVYAAGKKELDFTATVAPDSSIMLPLAGAGEAGGFDV